jgi:hypothetical protein
MSTFSPSLNLEEVARNGDIGVWDTPTNSNWTIMDSPALHQPVPVPLPLVKQIAGRAGRLQAGRYRRFKRRLVIADGSSHRRRQGTGPQFGSP